MQLISVDLGSYSIKFLKFRVDKNKITYDFAREVVIDTDEYNILAENIELDLQLKIVKDLLEDIEGEYRLILNAPGEIITTRFLNLPVKNRKKAQLMIPFQLEEDIPFSLGESHLAYSIQTGKDSSKALVNIAPKEDFAAFYEKLNEYEIVPKIATSQDSVCSTFIKQTKELLPQAFCVLDLGHHTTKAYFYFERELVAIHKSYIGGRALSEAISENYKIDFEEATLYKHQNCFLLTQDQYEQVNENQRTFAALMEKTLTPLSHEFKRWEVGFRVLQGVGISEVFITGGTSNIKNIHNFLTEQLETKTSYLESFDSNVDASKLDADEKFRRKFSYTNMQAQAYKEKSSLVNFLNEEFSIQGQSDLPLRSYAFIAARVALATLLLMVSFGAERMFLHRDISSIDQALKSISKNPVLEMTARQKRIVVTNPETVQRELKRKDKAIRQEVSVLQASAATNALTPLRLLANLTTGMDVEIQQFQSLSRGDFSAVFKAKSVQELNQLDKILNTGGVKNAFTDKNEDKLTISLSGSEG
ncbi:MAG: pilus assembly protein PilM [Bacteriovoracaceae bacterium]